MPNRCTRRQFLESVTACSAAFVAAAANDLFAATGHGRAPNIVLLYADDLGWTDLACFGSRYYETPNLDRLCAEGVKFTNAYSAAGNCAPARACLLTGQYVPRHGVYTVGGKRRFDQNKRLLKWNERKLLAPENAKGIAASKVTVAEALTSAGYVCGHFGKWHVGRDDDQVPDAQGFDHSTPMAGSSSHWITPDGRRRKSDDEPRKYLTDHLADNALLFIEKNRDRPFFLYFADYLVHVPLEAKEELAEKYRRKESVGGHRNAVYAAMIESLDHSCGRILGQLDELGLAENTIVVFFSDNGGCGSAKDRGLSSEGGITSNAPLRGMKGMLYEGGIRVPMIVRWPGVTTRGTTCSVPVIGMDLYPTFLDIAKGEPPPEQPLDGESLIPLLNGTSTQLRRSDIFWFMPGYLPGRQAPAHAVRSGRYKLIEYFEDGKLELFDLDADIGERHDLAAERPDKVRELHAKLTAWRAATGAEVPERNPNFDPNQEGRW